MDDTEILIQKLAAFGLTICPSLPRWPYLERRAVLDVKGTVLATVSDLSEAFAWVKARESLEPLRAKLVAAGLPGATVQIASYSHRPLMISTAFGGAYIKTDAPAETVQREIDRLVANAAAGYAQAASMLGLGDLDLVRRLEAEVARLEAEVARLQAEALEAKIG